VKVALYLNSAIFYKLSFIFTEPNYMTIFPAYDLGCIYIDLDKPQEALKLFELVLSFDANFTAAQEKVNIIRQYLTTQA